MFGIVVAGWGWWVLLKQGIEVESSPGTVRAQHGWRGIRWWILSSACTVVCQIGGWVKMAGGTGSVPFLGFLVIGALWGGKWTGDGRWDRTTRPLRQTFTGLWLFPHERILFGVNTPVANLWIFIAYNILLIALPDERRICSWRRLSVLLEQIQEWSERESSFFCPFALHPVTAKKLLLLLHSLNYTNMYQI